MQTLIGSRSNQSGIEVTHTTLVKNEQLRAYRSGELVATRLVERHGGRAFGGCVTFAEASKLSLDERVEIKRSLDEGVRILRDGRSVDEAA